MRHDFIAQFLLFYVVIVHQTFVWKLQDYGLMDKCSVAVPAILKIVVHHFTSRANSFAH